MPEPTPQWRNVLQDLWNKQSQWSKAASDHKSGLRSWNGPLIIIGFIGVVISTISPYIVPQTLKPEDWMLQQYILTAVGPVLVTIAALLTREILGPKEQQQWIKAREISEALKAEGYIFAVSAPPYSDPTNAPDLLATKIDELTAGTETVGLLPNAIDDPKRPRSPLTIEDYITTRVHDQSTFHTADARVYARKLSMWRSAAITLMVASSALGVVAGFAKQAAINVWVAVVSTALATVTAFVTASRFEFLAASYATTSERLEALVRRWRAKQAPSHAEADRFVLDCEAALAAQNHTWSDELSKRLNEKLKTAPSPLTPTPGAPAQPPI